MRIYIAGPMTGIEDLNFPAFYAAAEDLREQGYEVVNPAEMDKPEDIEMYDRDIEKGGASESWRYFLARDLEIVLTQVDAVAVLPGWERSVGAGLEVTACLASKKPVLEYPDLNEIIFRGGLFPWHVTV